MEQKRKKDQDRKKPGSPDQQVSSREPARQKAGDERLPSQAGPGASTGRGAERNTRGKERP